MPSLTSVIDVQQWTHPTVTVLFYKKENKRETDNHIR